MFRNHLDRLQDSRRDQRGFTLIELLMVIVILGILAAVVVFSVRGITDRGELSACKAEVKTVATAAEASYAKDKVYGPLLTLHTNGFLRGATVTEQYVDSVDAGTGAITLKSGVPAGCVAG